METLPFFAFVGSLALLAGLSLRFGYDSRDGFRTPPASAWWTRPGEGVPIATTGGQVRARVLSSLAVAGAHIPRRPRMIARRLSALPR